MRLCAGAATVFAVTVATAAGGGATVVVANANFNGTWIAVDPSNPANSASFMIVGENVKTGAFSGTVTTPKIALPVFRGTFPIHDGRVKGNTFSFWYELPGTVQGGAPGGFRSDLSGTFTATAAHVTIQSRLWSPKGTLVDYSTTSGTATRKVFDLSGKVIASPCGLAAATCSAKPTPVPGVTVSVSGAGEDSATTDKQGAYSLTLPGGTYEVTPSEGDRAFKPESRTVHLTANLSGVNFKTCTETTNATRQTAGGRGGEDGHVLDAQASEDEEQRQDRLHAVRELGKRDALLGRAPGVQRGPRALVRREPVRHTRGLADRLADEPYRGRPVRPRQQPAQELRIRSEERASARASRSQRTSGVPPSRSRQRRVRVSSGSCRTLRRSGSTSRAARWNAGRRPTLRSSRRRSLGRVRR